MRNLEEFNGCHYGQTCFIIGAGPSLHFQDLEPLKKYTTIAVNSGYCAFPEANYFVSDDGGVSVWSYFFRDLRFSTTIPILYEDKLFNQCSLFLEKPVIFRHRTGYNITDVYEHENKENRICQSRSSLGTAIHIAHVMGFKTIYVLGLDCCRLYGFRYFWEFPCFKDKPYKVAFGHQDTYKKQIVGRIETDNDLSDILEYWETTAKCFLEKVRVYNLSPITQVNGFPKRDLKTVLNELELQSV